MEASTVYRVDLATEQLEPLEEGWGLPPRHTLLKPDLVLVFDFGSEVPLPAPLLYDCILPALCSRCTAITVRTPPSRPASWGPVCPRTCGRPAGTTPNVPSTPPWAGWP